MTPQQQALTIAKNWENGQQAELLAKDILEFAAQMVEKVINPIPDDMVPIVGKRDEEAIAFAEGQTDWRDNIEWQKQALINQLRG